MHASSSFLPVRGVSEYARPATACQCKVPKHNCTFFVNRRFARSPQRAGFTVVFARLFGKGIAMDRRRSSTWCVVVGVGLALGLLCSRAGPWHRRRFTRTASKPRRPGPGHVHGVFDEIAHRIDDREPHNGQGSSISNSMSSRARRSTVYRTEAPINEELRASIRLRRIGRHSVMASCCRAERVRTTYSTT